jgi:hypothetical protein
MKIGKLNTRFDVYEQGTTKDAVGQETTQHTLMFSIYGQHVIRNMTGNMEANRENPMVSEYVYAYFETGLSAGQFLVDEFGNQFIIKSLRRTNDRFLIQLAVSQVTKFELNIV